MNFMPDPLHPAVVHFPIVFILVGTAFALAAVFLRRWALPAFAAGFLAFGALGAWVAVQTGESDGGLLDVLGAQAESTLEGHEMWAERTLVIAVIAAVLAIASALSFRFPRGARGVGALAALVACLASFSVYQTGHRGGALVFHHGAGINGVADAGQPVDSRKHASHDSDRDEDRD